MASSVPGITTPQVPAAEDGAPSTIDPSKTRKPKKRKGHRAGSTKEPKGHKQSIMTPMNGNESKPLMAPPFCYSFVVTTVLLFAGGAVVGLLMWLQADHVEVRTKSGSTVRGFRSYVANYRIYTFLGIPYAQPPVHNLRFRLPLPYSENSSVVPATLECPPCPQRGWFSPINEGWEGAEECLHLNVWTPCAETTTGGGCAKLPVLLFLFAEGFQTGSNMRFDGSLLAASQNLVVIAPNFRIGVLGFFHKDGHEMPGNLALHDQELVIKWVEDHADLFGGNWNNTVLMGATTDRVLPCLFVGDLGSHDEGSRQQNEVDSGYFQSSSWSHDYPDLVLGWLWCSTVPAASSSFGGVVCPRRPMAVAYPGPSKTSALTSIPSMVMVEGISSAWVSAGTYGG
nr:acetylcholinesterase-like [Rhipicephalus microplus]